ncbi:hypothetical protein [Streptomyces sp. NPDC097610]|uniref:hypothetical protein n=1 Tax=Streptomyces sp. NPDC097610 TaxID=3157227 RepID=UPI003318B7F3
MTRTRGCANWLDGPHEHIRGAAARHPGLPARVPIRLLRDRDTAQDAARHPVLPVQLGPWPPLSPQKAESASSRISRGSAVPPRTRGGRRPRLLAAQLRHGTRATCVTP